MRFHHRLVKNLVVPGVILVLVQILVSTQFDNLKVFHYNSSLAKVSSVLNYLHIVNKGTVFKQVRHVEHTGFGLAGVARNVSVAQQINATGTMQTVHAVPSKKVGPEGHTGSGLAGIARNVSVAQQINATGTMKSVHAAPSKKVGYEEHNGFELADFVHNVCVAQHIHATGATRDVHSIPSKRILYCPMEKIGTTLWRRTFYMLVAKDGVNYKHPYDVPIDTALEKSKLFSHSITSAKNRSLLTENSFSFLFVRNPFSRLLSAFVDKLVPPNPTYWSRFGVKAKSMFRPRSNVQRYGAKAAKSTQTINRYFGHDITFAEFVKFATSLEKSRRNIDTHIISINRGCKPCAYHYTYIGRMETFREDSLFIMEKLGINISADNFEERFSDLSMDDAITDSIRSPFEWKRDILKYISWDKALQRIWLKLQMRGIIEWKIKLVISQETIRTISVNDFIDMASKAHKASNPDELKRQKDAVKREAFASVALSDLHSFRETFKEDFALFGYDPEPAYIFHRNESPVSPSVYFNYSHLN